MDSITEHIRVLKTVKKNMEKVVLTDEERDAYNRVRNRLSYYQNKTPKTPIIKPVLPEPKSPIATEPVGTTIGRKVKIVRESTTISFN